MVPPLFTADWVHAVRSRQKAIAREDDLINLEQEVWLDVVCCLISPPILTWILRNPVRVDPLSRLRRLAIGAGSNAITLRNALLELNIIRDDPTAISWPPGLGEEFAAVLEECIPLEPWYLDSFSRYTWSDSACIRTMTDWVLARYNWVKFIQDGVMGNKEQREKLQMEFDAYVNQGYDAKQCFSG